MHNEKPSNALQATELVQEAYLRLVKAQQVDWQSWAHPLTTAARPMRQMLIERARRQKTEKHGGDQTRLPLVEALTAVNA
jgi:DNA-directed RNA polymerase specialized sigma24 family protein